MASMFGASIFSPSSSLASYQQYGSRVSYYPTQRLPFLKLSDIAYNSSSLSLTVKAQVSVSETLAKSELPVTSETLDSPASELPERRPHLSPLINEILDGADVPSAMEPWLEKLTIHDWDALVRRFGDTDWATSWQIVSFFREKASLLDESVLWPKNMESEASMDEGEDSEEGEDAEERPASPSPSSEAAAEAGAHDVSSASEESQTGLKKPPPILILYKTLAKVVARNKKFDELQRLQEQMLNDGVQPNFSFYSVVLNLYIAEGLTEKVSEIIAKMETAGFKPTKFTYEKIAYMHMKKEVPDLSAATTIMKDLMGKGLPVDVGIFKNLLKAHWRNKDVAGAEEVFQAMQAAGYTPDLKVVLKVMYCHKQTGNYKRILELKEMLTNWGIQPNVGVYDQLIYAYCKAGLLEKAKETLLEYESVDPGRKPTLVAFNMLVNAYGKQGLHEEALEIFDQIQANKYRPNVVSYASIIFALAQAANLNKAAQLYRRMVKQGIQPKLYTYLSLIRGYTKLDWTREGRKISNYLRRSPLEMTPEAYGVVLILFVEGNWYVHAAPVLKEMEKESVALDSAAKAALIRSFSNVGSKLTPLAKAVEASHMEICKLLSSLFITKLEPAPEEAVLSYLEKLEKDEGRALIYNAFMECFWRRGLKTVSRRILSSAREAYAKHTQPQLLETEWVLDVRGLSVGGAKVALTEWLVHEGEQKEEKPKDDVKIVLVTGDDFQLNVVQDNRILKRALSSMLENLGSPFVESLEDSKKLEADAPKVMEWGWSDKVKEVLNFTDEPSPWL